MDCVTGDIPGCSIYQNAYCQCQSAFARATGCVVSGDPAKVCAGGLGTYSYGCLSGKAPAGNCSALPASAGTVPMFCCF